MFLFISLFNISATFGIYNNTINNAIQIIETDPVNNETTTIPENLNHSITTGLELIDIFCFRLMWKIKNILIRAQFIGRITTSFFKKITATMKNADTGGEQPAVVTEGFNVE